MPCLEKFASIKRNPTSKSYTAESKERSQTSYCDSLKDSSKFPKPDQDLKKTPTYIYPLPTFALLVDLSSTSSHCQPSCFFMFASPLKPVNDAES